MIVGKKDLASEAYAEGTDKANSLAAKAQSRVRVRP